MSPLLALCVTSDSSVQNGWATHQFMMTSEHNFWAWINSGRRLQPRAEFVSSPLPTGTRLRATDRIYVVQSNGAYKRVSYKGIRAIPFKDSNLAVRSPELNPRAAEWAKK